MQTLSRKVSYLDAAEFRHFLEGHPEGSIVGFAWITHQCPIARYMHQHWGKPNVRVRRMMIYEGVVGTAISALSVCPMPLWAQHFYDLVTSRMPETPLDRADTLKLLDSALALAAAELDTL